MDEFGVLVESIGFKAQGRSTPMAHLKRNPKPSSLNRPKSVYDSNSINGSFDVDLDGIFQSGNNRKAHNSTDFDGFDDVFGGPVRVSKPSGGDGFDFDAVFKGSNSNNFSVNSSLYDDDDIFGGLNSSMKVNNDDIFESVASFGKQSAPVEDLLGNFGGMGLGSSGKVEKNAQGSDDLIPGFRESSPLRNGENAETSLSPISSGHSAKSTSTSAEDPFVGLEPSTQAYTSGWFSERVEGDAGKSSVLSSFDELEGFAMGNVRNVQTNYSQKESVESASPDLDSFFSMGAKQSKGSSHKSPMVDPVYDSLFQSRGNPVAESIGNKASPTKNTTTPRTSSIGNKASPTKNVVDDFSLFFGEVAPSTGEFQEIEGESDERRRARLNHHMRTQQRMAKALAEKNQRDFQTQQEQEERHRIAETLDGDIKRWAAGKEGNLRALLSSLQIVLWPECGWRPVSLTDLITSISVKKVYHKATLCVHPDKVQQKGANIEQKYIAEKVFDLLKEAWNKFNAEEL